MKTTMGGDGRGTCDGPVVIIGAGPAGLTAAYSLARRGVEVIVVEQDCLPGGIAKTVEYKGFRFDIGGHRFFTKFQAVRELWHELLGDELLVRPRVSRIYCRGRFFDYPLRVGNVFLGFGIVESFLILGSYLRSRIFRISPEKTLADWVTNRFGRRLFNLFFRSYTEKVWGVLCDQIGAQWAAQRIQGLSLRTALAAMFRRPGGSGSGEPVRTLIGSFLYPRLGPGMMWDALCRDITEHGGTIRFASSVTRICHENGRIAAVEVKDRHGFSLLAVAHLISTMPLQQVAPTLSESVPSEVLEAAGKLRYRDFLTVALIVNGADLFPDTWVYIHDDALRVGRIQNFKNWSPAMTPDPGKSCLGMEYFCFEDDELWSMTDVDLIGLATSELEATGLVSSGMVIDGTVVRITRAYPMYDEGYQERVTIIREYLAGFDNLQVIGRNGMHRYNNMDHSMLTGLLASRNLFGENNDLWSVNGDEEYHEEGSDVTG